MNKNTHFLAADILRGIAIAMVVVYHAFTPVYGHFLPWRGWFRDFSAPPSEVFMAAYPVSFGWAGVALFFVLSGFCIHLSFLRSSAFSLRRFFWHRFWRIVPAYFAALVALTLLTHEPLNTPLGLKQFCAHALFIQNFRANSFFGINPSFWSIATEVQLYLLFPVLLFIRHHYGMKGCLLTTFSIGMLWRIGAVAAWGLPDHVITPALTSPFATWFDWTLGALTVLSFMLAAAVSAVVLDWLVRADIRRNVVTAVAGFVGTVSYSIYLWHQPLLFRLSTRIERYTNQPITVLAVAAFLFLLAYISFRIFERGGILVGAVLWQRTQKTA